MPVWMPAVGHPRSQVRQPDPLRPLQGSAAREADQLVARFRQGVPKKQLALGYGVALSTVKRLISGHS